MGRGDFQKPGELFFQGSVVDVFLQVLVLVHQVFLDLMTHSFFKLSDAALLILDECHHAQVGNNNFRLYFIKSEDVVVFEKNFQRPIQICSEIQ